MNTPHTQTHNLPHTVANCLLNAIAPERCIICLDEGSYLCGPCKTSLPRPTHTCIVCDRPHASGRTCPDCKPETPIDALVTAGPYTALWLRRGIKWLKFRGVRGIAPALAWLLVEPLSHTAPLGALQTSGILIPAPLHADRLRTRGFNQATEIAAALSHITTIPVIDCLIRTKNTRRQARLPHSVRKTNLNDAFRLARPIPRHVSYAVLIDDVATTGATLTAAATAIANEHPDIRILAAALAKG